MRKILALILTLTMVVGLMSVTVWADDTDPTDPTAPTEGEVTEATTGSIKITGAKTDPEAATTTYEAYRIFDMTTSGATNESGNYTTVAYTINSSWAGFFAAGAAGAGYIVDTNTTGTLNQIAITNSDGTTVTKYINITDSNVADFAYDAYVYAMETPVAPVASQNVAKGTTEVTFNNLELGYYMVYPKGATINIGNYTSIVSITNTDPDAEIAQKAEYPTLTKTADDISVEVGQKVTYTLTSKVPDVGGYSKYEMKFSDTTTAGLTFDGVDTITVKIGEATLKAGTDYTVSTDTPDFALTINMLKTEGTGENAVTSAKYAEGATITITYTATVNENAVTKIDKNHATLTYNNDPKDDESTGTTPPVEVKTYSSKVSIKKVDGDNKTTTLAGAKFVLRAKTVGTAEGDTHETDLAAGKYYYYDATAKDVKWITVTDEDPAALAVNTEITVVETDANGVAEFTGLENGVYELIEVVAPEGYNLVTTPTPVTISGSDADETALTVNAEVENKAGTVLPSTGGIGTTIFYIVGGLLAVGAGVVLVTKKRMSKEDI